MKNEPPEYISFSVSPNMKRLLQTIAKDEDRSLSKTIMRLISEALHNRHTSKQSA